MGEQIKAVSMYSTASSDAPYGSAIPHPDIYLGEMRAYAQQRLYTNVFLSFIFNS